MYEQTSSVISSNEEYIRTFLDLLVSGQTISAFDMIIDERFIDTNGEYDSYQAQYIFQELYTKESISSYSLLDSVKTSTDNKYCIYLANIIFDNGAECIVPILVKNVESGPKISIPNNDIALYGYKEFIHASQNDFITPTPNQVTDIILYNYEFSDLFNTVRGLSTFN